MICKGFIKKAKIISILLFSLVLISIPTRIFAAEISTISVWLDHPKSSVECIEDYHALTGVSTQKNCSHHMGYAYYSSALVQNNIGGEIQVDRYYSVYSCSNLVSWRLDRLLSCVEYRYYRNDPESPASCLSDPILSNPVRVSTGSKNQSEIDYLAGGRFPLSIRRTYSSDRGSWYFNNKQTLFFTSSRIIWMTESGYGFTFREVDGVWSVQDSPQYSLEQQVDSTWIVRDANLNTHKFDENGRLILSSNIDNIIQSFEYDPSGNVITVSRNTGGSLTYSYNSVGQVIGIVTDTGQSFSYDYLNGNLIGAYHPGEVLPTVYHYENPSFLHAFTGISDSKGIRYATWAYDSAGRVISSEHFNGADHFDFDYSNYPQVMVSNPLGKQTTYSFQLFSGVKKLVQVEGHQSANCAAANKNYTYYPSGVLETKTDWKNNTTSYQYNTRNLESSRTEALGTPQERTITTEWHPTFNLRTKITEPGKETVFTYDVQGRLQSQVSNAIPLQ